MGGQTGIAQADHMVDERLPTPLYHQVYLVLRTKILNADYPHNSYLPGEQDTAAMFNVSRITAKRALNELAAEGLCVREKGRGTRVTHKAVVAPLKAGIEGLFENLQEMGLRTKVHLERLDYIPAAGRVARALRIKDGEEVQRAVRIRHLDEKAFSYLTTYVPGEIGRTYTGEDLIKSPLLALIENSGVTIASAEQTISATLADSHVSRALDVEFGSPLLQINRIVYDQSDRAVEYITALYRQDRYQYRMSLTRAGNGSGRIWSQSDGDVGRM